MGELCKQEKVLQDSKKEDLSLLIVISPFYSVLFILWFYPVKPWRIQTISNNSGSNAGWKIFLNDCHYRSLLLDETPFLLRPTEKDSICARTNYFFDVSACTHKHPQTTQSKITLIRPRQNPDMHT